MAEKQDSRSFEFSLFSPELSDIIWQLKTHILNFKSSRSKDVRQNLALGILNRGRFSLDFCAQSYFTRGPLFDQHCGQGYEILNLSSAACETP